MRNKEKLQEKIKDTFMNFNKSKEELENKIEKNEKIETYKFFIEKAFILGIIIVYILLITNNNIGNFISKSSQFYSYLGLGALILFLMDTKARSKKIGMWIFIFVLALVMLVVSGDGQLSEAALKNKRTSIFSLNKNGTTKLENTSYDIDYGLNGKPAKQVDPNNMEIEFMEPVLKSNINYDFDSGTFFITNRIMIIFENTTTYKMAEEFGQKNNMRLVGQTVEINQFTYELPNNLDFRRMTEQKNIITELEEVKIVDYAFPPQKAVEDLKKEGIDQVSSEKRKELYNKHINQDGVVEVTYDNYLKVLEYIYEAPEFFEGKKIKLSGRSFSDKNMESNQMGLGMWQMYCCALDMNLVGYLTKNTKDLNLELDKWYSVEGTIRLEMQLLPGAITKSLEPIIDLESATEIQEPENKIVY